ncbi:MAG TPA: aminotransferase class III-fold pyridoxal phosphate-dependent enzyme, partial [Nocardioidaceae bacterium]|nr:aminotransferase class III-fold pyridoxal phosphate-dependent enzyme [Nocardioidaceae bacterium]
MPPTTQVLAKGPTQYVDGVAPKYAARARGARLWDVDGNEYLDYSMGVGPVSLGYANPEVDDAIRRQLDDGITFSLMHPLEVEVSELLAEVVPCAEAVRFGKSGATSASSSDTSTSRGCISENVIPSSSWRRMASSTSGW